MSYVMRDLRGQNAKSFDITYLENQKYFEKRYWRKNV